jgi:hypothetical protein
MSKLTKSKATLFSYVFWAFLIFTLAIWILRGLRILTGIHGWIFWVSIFATIATAAIARVQRPRRY